MSDQTPLFWLAASVALLCLLGMAGIGGWLFARRKGEQVEIDAFSRGYNDGKASKPRSLGPKEPVDEDNTLVVQRRPVEAVAVKWGDKPLKDPPTEEIKVVSTGATAMPHEEPPVIEERRQRDEPGPGRHRRATDPKP